MRRDRDDAVAVAIHDVEPATYPRAALIRDWLDDHGIDRVTLLVVPAPDLHPFSTRAPSSRAGCWSARTAATRSRSTASRAGGPEFAHLGHEEARRAVDSGRRLLKLAGVEPLGFVAPGYAYTPVLRATVRERYAWWADLMRLHRPRAATRLRRPSGCSPLALRAGALLGGPLLRIDLRPTDLDHTRHMLALERVLRRARRRTAVTYDQLAAA